MRRFWFLFILLLASPCWAVTIDIPVQQWVRLDEPDTAYGPRAQKHVSWAYCPLDNKLYSMGGDFDTVESGTQSYAQTQFSLDLGARFAGTKNTGWAVVYPYCGANGQGNPGGVQPKSPDFVGWTWDSTRNVFWYIPGTAVSPVAAICSDRTASPTDDTKYKFMHVMSFNPFAATAITKWTDVNENYGPYVVPPEQWKSHYDATSDSIIQLTRNTSGNAVAKHITVANLIAGNAWIVYDQGTDNLGRTIYWEKQGSALDPATRTIYTGDCFYGGRFFKYNIATHTKTHIGALPTGACESGNPDNDENFAFDTNNNVVLYFGNGDRKIYAYNPATAAWETLPQTKYNFTDTDPWVRHSMVYDPSQNVVALMGNNGDPYTNPYIYLYRYGTGITTMPVNSWMMSTSSDTISDHTPASLPGCDSGSAFESIVTAWGGAAYDNFRGRYLLGLNGGHNDYDGNEIYGQSISGDESWSRLWGPSASIPGCPRTSLEQYSTDNPSSRHVYQGEVYHPGTDSLVVVGGIVSSPGGTGTKATWLHFFSGVNAGTWKRGPDWPCGGTYDGSGMVTYDPSNGKIYASVGTISGFATFTPSTTSPYGSWSSTNCSMTGTGEGSTWALDYTNRKILVNGTSLFAINADTGARSTPSTSGSCPSFGGYYKDMAFDPVLGKIIYHDSGRNFYTLDASGSTIVCASITGTGDTPPSESASRHEGRLTYMSDQQAFALVNGIAQRTYFLRTSPYGGGGIPPVVPPDAASLIGVSITR